METANSSGLVDMVEAYIGGTGNEKDDEAVARYERDAQAVGYFPALYILLARIDRKLDKLLTEDPGIDPDSGIPYLPAMLRGTSGKHD